MFQTRDNIKNIENVLEQTRDQRVMIKGNQLSYRFCENTYNFIKKLKDNYNSSLTYDECKKIFDDNYKNNMPVVFYMLYKKDCPLKFVEDILPEICSLNPTDDLNDAEMLISVFKKYKSQKCMEKIFPVIKEMVYQELSCYRNNIFYHKHLGNREKLFCPYDNETMLFIARYSLDENLKNWRDNIAICFLENPADLLMLLKHKNASSFTASEAINNMSVNGKKLKDLQITYSVKCITVPFSLFLIYHMLTLLMCQTSR